MIVEQISKRFKKKILQINLEDINFKWEFEDFFQILNINNFITMMQHQLKISYNFTQEQDIREKIIKIREFLTQMVDEIKDYKINLNQITILDNLMHMIYMEIKEIINEGLIKYLFFEKIHFTVEYNQVIYDTDDYFKLKLMEFKENVNNHFEIFIKSFKNKQINDNFVF
ncbi:hypothetical protein [Spiroplasma cantharicola]|uniref:Uncharacterized protein n=1 Tax=Spiroplasma cantharicola TaxID=362837 RepID=A0A0M4JX87_9MOLU|nr:hypothetical protein [Spiroplasma cantharicola]ALD66692.1 hypothetical protein SCANT_v1c07860 [Spiroplasma cantharicola]